jgi:hypothetical protein
MTLLEKAKPAAQKEFAELTAFAKELDAINQLENGWLLLFREIKQKLYSLDDELLNRISNLKMY